MTWSADVTEHQSTAGALPIIVEPRRPASLLAVVERHAQAVEATLSAYGAIFFRNFAQSGENVLATLFERLWAPPISYIYRSTPRTNVGEGVYTATEYPAALEIPMHNENAYQRDWPMRIGFHCVTPSATGGQTPLADVGRVTAHIDPVVIAEFRQRGVSYVRNYSEFFDLPWQTVFQTDSKSTVEKYCQANDIDFEWTESGLSTQQACQGTASHPETGEELWFNQAQLFHVSSLGPEKAADMIDLFGEHGLPRNAYFGDGGAIPDSVIAHVCGAFEREKLVFDWRKDDILILDNMRIAHGRAPFVGSRRVLVSMGCPYSTFWQAARSFERCVY